VIAHFRNPEPLADDPAAEPAAWDFAQIAKYHRHLSAATAGREVEDKLWSDLDMELVFRRLDQTATPLGQQVLYHQIRTWESDPQTLAQQPRLRETLTENPGTVPALREKMQGLAASDGYRIIDLLFNPSMFAAGLLVFAQVMAVALLVVLLLCFVNFNFVFVLITLALANLVLSRKYESFVFGHATVLLQLNALLNVAVGLGEAGLAPAAEPVQKLAATAGFSRRLAAKLHWQLVDKSRQPELVAMLFTYLNVFFLFELIACLRSLRELNRHQAVLLEIYAAVGTLDATLAVVNFLAAQPHVCVPVIADEAVLTLEDFYHPLTTAPVFNSIKTGESLLITGSNMAGKTTFSKGVALNLLFARTLHFCFARAVVMPPLKVMTSIHRVDLIEDHKSYFMVEVEEIRRLLELSQDPASRHLFVIDEIFRGTNPTERLAAAAAVLNFLGRRSLVIVTTHDTLLASLLDQPYTRFHFTEHMQDGKLQYDYLLKPGLASGGNAIRLLEQATYPAEVVRAAHQFVEQLADRHNLRP